MFTLGMIDVMFKFLRLLRAAPRNRQNPQQEQPR